MVDINDRLKKIYDHYNFKSYAEFSKKTNISHQNASNYLKGKQKPDADKLALIVQAFDEISAEWIVTGKGNMFKKTNLIDLEKSQLSENDLQVIIAALLKYEEILLLNPTFKQWLDNKLLIRENEILREISSKNKGKEEE
jgi:transcriptional regulator with XRE-family HTH domain